MPNTKQLSTYFDDVAWDNDTTSSEEHFPTAPLDDAIWSEDPIPDRQLCINETPQEPKTPVFLEEQPIQKHYLPDGLTTIYTTGYSSA